MILSRPCMYAIRALTYLAMQPAGKLSGTREISLEENIPSSFLGKVLLQLRRKHLLRSYKGIGGGYELAMSADRINLLVVVSSVDGDDLFESCILEERQCVPQQPCAIHDAWAQIREEFRKTLETSTVAELVRARRLASEGMASRAFVELNNGPKEGQVP